MPASRWHGTAAMLVLVAGLIGAPAGPATADTLERFNAWSASVNRSLATNAVAPTLAAVRALPAPVGEALANAYGNLVEPISTLGWALAGEGEAAGRSAARFTINSTVGLLGLFDVASGLGLPPRRKALSEGVCALGLPPGPVLVVPAVGPTATSVFATALALIVGSTWALTYVSVELAIASLGLDVITGAAALENVVDDAGGTAAAPTAAPTESYEAWLREIGCADGPA